MRTDKKHTIKIGYKEFDVFFVDRFKEKLQLGECEYPLGKRDKTKGKIRIVKRLSKVEKANTLLHEIIHAIMYTQGVHLKDSLEERIVLAVTNGIIAFIKDNPDYADKLLKLLKQKPRPHK